MNRYHSIIRYRASDMIVHEHVCEVVAKTITDAFDAARRRFDAVFDGVKRLSISVEPV
jgi:hypothetical protein